MRHYDGKHPQHPLIPDQPQFDWVEITYKHGAGRVTDGPYYTRAEEALGQEISSFIMDELKRPGPFDMGMP